MSDADTGPLDDADPGQEPLPVIPLEDPTMLTAEPVTPRRKGRPIIAWIVICLCVGIVLAPRFIPARFKKQEQDETVGLVTEKMQAKYLVGASQMLGKQADFVVQAKKLNTGPIDQRLRAVVLVGEMAGPQEALNELEALRLKIAAHNKKPTGTQADLLDILRRLSTDYANNKLDAPTVSTDERALLREQLNWFGDLALAPAGGPDTKAREAVTWPAYRTVVVYFGFFGLAGLIGVLGLAGLIIFLILLFTGKLNRGIHCGSFHGSLYAETFALWLVLFLGLSFAGQLLLAKWLPEGNAHFLFTLITECWTLGILCWPVVRGLPWRQVRWEIGLNFGKRPALEPFVGLAGNAMAIPLLAIGILLTLALLYAQNHWQTNVPASDNFNPPDLPSHPIVKELAQAKWLEYLQLFILASVVAPIVEETMFRGVLYRHLREATCNMGYAGSVLLSAFVVSFIFAVIHPQGFIGVPPLMALAFMFSLLREWRGSLIPGMVAHGVNNGVVLLFSILAMTD